VRLARSAGGLCVPIQIEQTCWVVLFFQRNQPFIRRPKRGLQRGLTSLEKAENNPEPDEIRVRDRLERLYRDIRNEYSNRWTDIQDLKKEKRELQKEIKLQEKEDFS